MTQPLKSLSPAFRRTVELDYYPALVSPLGVNAGPNQSMLGVLTGITDGSVYSDGAEPITQEWSVVSGPGTVTFTDSTALATTFSVTEFGTYVFRLTAVSGSWSDYDDTVMEFTQVTCPVITVQPQSQEVTAPTPVTLTITLDTVPIGTTYTWEKWNGSSWVPVIGGNTSSLYISDSTGLDGSQYRCLINATFCAELTSSTATLTVNPPPPNLMVLVAGGGSGGLGGGGAGEPKIDANFTIPGGASFPIVIGNGGAPVTCGVQAFRGNVGQDSTAFGLTAKGGGGGGNSSDLGFGDGGSGGCGGGSGASGTGLLIGGSGTAGQAGGGNANIHSSPYPAAGGGGYVGAGGNALANNIAGGGGDGITIDVAGVNMSFSGGGGGTCYFDGIAGTGGIGGGAAGRPVSGGDGFDATPNTGGGGGGAGNNRQSGRGGSGVMILAYYSAVPLFSGGTITSRNGYQIHTFTTSGTLTRL